MCLLVLDYQNSNDFLLFGEKSYESLAGWHQNSTMLIIK
jgi:hypothetical protein